MVHIIYGSNINLQAGNGTSHRCRILSVDTSDCTYRVRRLQDNRKVPRPVPQSKTKPITQQQVDCDVREAEQREEQQRQEQEQRRRNFQLQVQHKQEQKQQPTAGSKRTQKVQSRLQQQLHTQQVRAKQKKGKQNRK